MRNQPLHNAREQWRLYVATMLEMVAALRPDLLRHTIDTSNTLGLTDLAKLWGVEVEAMHDVALKAVKDLNHLERKRGGCQDSCRLKVLFQSAVSRAELGGLATVGGRSDLFIPGAYIVTPRF